jgi:hypothetical protein
MTKSIFPHTNHSVSEPFSNKIVFGFLVVFGLGIYAINRHEPDGKEILAKLDGSLPHWDISKHAHPEHWVRLASGTYVDTTSVEEHGDIRSVNALNYFGSGAMEGVYSIKCEQNLSHSESPMTFIYSDGTRVKKSADDKEWIHSSDTGDLVLYSFLCQHQNITPVSEHPYVKPVAPASVKPARNRIPEMAPMSSNAWSLISERGSRRWLDTSSISGEWSTIKGAWFRLELHNDLYYSYVQEDCARRKTKLVSFYTETDRKQLITQKASWNAVQQDNEADMLVYNALCAVGEE